MSRFVNLEFEGESGENRTSGANRDEQYYMTEAHRALENGHFEAALRQYSKVLEFNPRNAAAWTGQVRMLIELGEYREARLWAEKALERFAREPELLAAKAVALARAGDTEEALACSDASIEERGDSYYLWLARGDVLLARKETRADYCFEKALLLAPRDWLVAWLAARSRFFYEQFAHGLKLLQQALEWNPGHFLLWLEMGRGQHAIGLVGAAYNSLTQAKQLNPGSPEVVEELRALSDISLFKRLVGWVRKLASP